ncbi:MAG: class I SAM-dependent methyltransferase [Pseudomonadota bacterium]
MKIVEGKQDILQRRDPVKLREELREKLTPEEIRELGVNLGAGSDHPRAFVGPPFVYDMLGGLQMQLLLDLGMREYHRFLEVGCGSLRLGRMAIPYLLNGRYFGVEPNQKILDGGCELHFGAPMAESQVIKAKGAKFSNTEDFDFSFTEGPVDFVFAQSIASHTGIDLTKKLLSAFASVSHDDTIVMVTYVRTMRVERSNTEDGWFYPECVLYTDDAFGEMARAAGFYAYRTVWPLGNVTEEGLISTQHPTILTRKPWAPSAAQMTAGGYVNGIAQIN